MNISVSRPYSRGSTAPPPMAMISNEEPIFVNFPNPSIARGQIEGHMSELARPSNATKVMEV